MRLGTVIRSVVIVCTMVVAACDDENPWGPEDLIEPPPEGPVPAQITTNMYVARTAVAFNRIRAECEHYLRTQEDTVVVLPDVGVRTNIPEFHDCQRMIIGNGTEYGPLIGIYSTPYRPEFVESSKAYLVAVILNYHDTYAPLGIQHGVKCLYIKLGNKAQDHAAWIVTSEDGTIECGFSRLVASLGDPVLNIQRDLSANPHEYPRAARWDWDAANQEQYIGVECGGWCEVGRANFAKSPPPALLSGLPGNSGNRVYKIKGWYDVQHLAVLEANTNRLVPGRAVGYLFPSPGLHNVSNLGQLNENFPAAVAWVSEPSTVYDGKYVLNERAATRIALAGMNANAGVAKLKRGGESVVTRTVTRTPHPDGSPKLPGMARWHWTESDEKAWVACVNGCCQVNP